MKANLIHSIEICNVWKRYDFCWEKLNPDVNILIGINGSGKTTLFNVIDSVFTADVKRLKTYGVDVKVGINDFVVEYNSKVTINNWPLIGVILLSWSMAFFEYSLQIPGNRIGFQGNGGPFSLVQLKVIQEVITLIIFALKKINE